jgi:AcrR family transcriptional regulator
MNKTKRKIFETAMTLFAQKGYEATSVEEITATVGVAKGTLYYHFSSKEEIYNFLIDEGMKLLYNSIEIKTANLSDPISKLKAVIIIQLKIIMKYDEFITILLSQIWGNEPRHQYFRKYIYEYIDIIKKIIKEGIDKGVIKQGNSELIASMIFGAICSMNIHKKKMNGEMDLVQLSNDIVEYAINGIII